MTNENTAQQLELAAQILRTGHPWGYRQDKGPVTSYKSPLEVIQDGNVLIPLLATPPDGRPLINPRNLNGEQVGAGYRLIVAEDDFNPDAEVWDDDWGGVWRKTANSKNYTYQENYRLPLSVPWPEAKPDPYAELKKAHAEGKVIQGCINGHWIDCPHPTWKYPVNTYREKPDEKKTVPLEDETLADLSDDEIIKIRRLLKWFNKAFLAVDA